MKRITTTLLALIVVCSICSVGSASRLIDNLEVGKHQTLVTYGTSLTAGGAWVGQVRDALAKRYPGLINVVNAGRGGMWSTWGVENLDQRVIARKPDTILIEFAINDAFSNYKTSVELARKNLENMINRILKANPNCEIVLMTMNPPVGVHLERRPDIEKYYEMYRDVALDRKLHLIDHHPRWVAILEKDRAEFNRLVPDGIHPGPAGCAQVTTPFILESLGLKPETTEQ